MGTARPYECLDYDKHCNDRPDRSLYTIETSYPGLQNIVSNSPISLGSIVDGTKIGRCIQLVPVTTRNSSLTLISTSIQIMGFIDTTVTVVKVV